MRELTQAAGALLIFDEVVSGFRYALGGASELYKVTPDMAAFGKGMGNGLPISAVAGRADVMELIGTQGVFISTTFGGETLSMAGSMATLAILAQQGMTMIVITHEMNFARRVADRVVFMADGQIVETGTPDEFFDHPQTKRAQDFLNSIKGH